MNTRQRHELRLLAERGEFDLERLALDFDVSVRLIRYDIDDLNVCLLDVADGADAIVVRQKSARLKEGIARWQIMALSSAGERNFAVSPLSSRERVLLSVFTLCWLDDFTTVQSLADDYCVSRATVVRDLQKVREYCESHGLELVSNRGRGVRIEADEKSRRRVIAQVIRDYGAIAGIHSGLEVADYLKWFSESELGLIASIVREAERFSDLYLDDIAFEAMVVHIALSIKRCRAWIEMPEPFLPVPPVADSGLQFEMASFIVKKVREVFGVQLPEAEHYYIEVHIRVRSSEAIAAAGKHDAVLEFMCISMIAEVSRELGIDLTHDAHLFERLLQHVGGSVYRRQTGLLLENPLRDELLSNYAGHATTIRRALEHSGLSKIIAMTPDEIAYVLLHFEAALVGGNGDEGRHANVVVVCSTGFGTAELLSAELKRCFDMNLIANIPSHQVHSLDVDTGVDLVITTVPLDIDIPCVEVRPLLREADVERIGRVLRTLGFGKDVDLPPLRDMGTEARNVARILRRHPGRDDEPRLLRELKHYLDEKSTERQEGSYMLSELLEGHVVLDATCASWEDAVRASGAPLVSSGDITEEYIEAVIANINEAGPYVVITKQVALPHATNRVGVNRTAMSCVRLKDPVEFGSKENDPVKYEFMLATVDSTSHIQALMSLVGLLRTKEFLELLSRAESADEVVAFVRAYEDSASKQKER